MTLVTWRRQLSGRVSDSDVKRVCLKTELEPDSSKNILEEELEVADILLSSS